MPILISANAVIRAVISNDVIRGRDLRLTRGSLNIVSTFLKVIDRDAMGRVRLAQTRDDLSFPTQKSAR
jgi:hypothetical protein